MRWKIVNDTVNPTLFMDDDGDGNFTDRLIQPNGGTGIHNIAVTSIATTRTAVAEGSSVLIEVITANRGGFPENVNLTIYYNDALIDTKVVTDLPPGHGKNTSFIWNTTDVIKGNYTIRVYAEPVYEEVYISDNNLTDSWIIIAMVGDISGPEGYPDGKCDMWDVGNVARLFYVNHADPEYDPNCDIVYDRIIDMRDIGTVARHFGQIDP